MQTKKVGTLTSLVCKLLNIHSEANKPILIGEQNIRHIKEKHPDDYFYYGHMLEEIRRIPDYVGIAPKNKSISYIKEVSITPDRIINIAVRMSTNGTYFVRSFYNINIAKINNGLEKGTVFKLTHKK